MAVNRLDQVPTPADNILILQIKKGNTAVFKSLFDRYYKKLCYFAWRILDDQSEAEDLVQEVFVRLWQNKHDLDISRSLNAFLYQSVKNACLNQIKHRKVKLAYAQNFKATSEVSTQNTIIETSELKALIELNINKLPPERRKIFIMSRKEGMKHKEIADELGISVKTVDNQIAKALKYFRQVLQDYLPWYIIAAWLESIKEINF